MTWSIMSDPLFGKKPNLIIIHSGTNDIQNNVNTLQKIRKVIFLIKKYDTDDNIKIALSSIIHWSDHDFEDKINENNTRRILKEQLPVLIWF